MLGLQGSNVKLTPKPPSPARKKSKVQTSAATFRKPNKNGLENMESTDSDSGVGHIRSGNVLRRSTSAGTQKGRPNSRKLSQPEPLRNMSASSQGSSKRRFSMSTEAEATASSNFKQSHNKELVKQVEFQLPAQNYDLSFDTSTTATPEFPELEETYEMNESNYDQLLLTESDNLIQDVVSLCNEMGIDSSGIASSPSKLNQASASSFAPQNSQFGCSEKENEVAQSISLVEEIQTEPETLCKIGDHRNSEELACQNQVNLPKQEAEKAGNQKTYDRIISALRLIEEDENNPQNVETIRFNNKLQDVSTSVQSSSALSLVENEQLSTISRAKTIISSTQTPSQSPRQNVQQLTQSFSTSDIHSLSSSRLSHHIHVNYRSISPLNLSPIEDERAKSVADFCSCINDEVKVDSNEKTRNIYSFLDEVEKSDRAILFNLKFDKNSTDMRNERSSPRKPDGFQNSNNIDSQTIDSLIRKGSVELAKELLLLERKYEDTLHNVRVLEETLLSQRELNMRNLKNSERDLKKRLKLQQEEFELALSRNQSFVDQMIAEKRSLQDKCEKVLKDSKESELKYQDQIKFLQQKHLEEIKRLRKVQEVSEKSKKQKWLGAKTQEIKDLTVKGLEPSVQRIIQRHQQEMAEMRAWHADEIHEIEERYARKQAVNLQEMRESFSREKDEVGRREREAFQNKLKSELDRCRQELDNQRVKLLSQFEEEREGFWREREKFKEMMEENVRRAELKGQMEIENLKQEQEKQARILEKHHENELKILKDACEVEKENITLTLRKKYDSELRDHDASILANFKEEKEKELLEREKKLKSDFDKISKEEGEANEARFKRLQEKYQSGIADLESSEDELKQKLANLKNQIMSKDEQLSHLQTTLVQSEKQAQDLIISNTRMIEERVNLTSIIRREFAKQIETLEEDCRVVKAAVLELKNKHKLELESHRLEMEKALAEKDIEMDQVSVRVRQTMTRKEETLEELRVRLEESRAECRRLESLLEEQRREFVGSLTSSLNKSKRK